MVEINFESLSERYGEAIALHLMEEIKKAEPRIIKEALEAIRASDAACFQQVEAKEDLTEILPRPRTMMEANLRLARSHMRRWNTR